ncbi:MAG: type II secretion system F family protein [Proteobacteria bacterium]|nr:type II secretion system F family protein [Pseudomonadota bacterium]
MASTFTILSSLIVVAFFVGAAYFGYPWIEEFAKKTVESYLQDCELLLHRCFKEMPRKKMIIIIASSTMFMALLGFIVTLGFGWINILFTVTLGFIGYQSFRMWLKFAWERRLNAFNEQLVDALNLLANSLKSGLNLSQALQVLIQESKPPMSQEFGMVLSQEKLGLTIDEALEKMLERIPSDDLAIAIHSVLILRETGGDLSETFETIASTIRERRKVSGKIKSMTQQGKMQGLILLLLPFGLGAMLYMVNPPYIIPLVTTQLGWIMIFIMLMFQGVGALWIKKIVNIDV